MSPDYRIELAAEVHVQAIPAIEQAASAMFSEEDLPTALRYLVTDQETLLEAQRQQRLWAALEGRGKLVGFALARIVGDYAHLEEMDVHPAHGGQGLGGRLLAAVKGWAAAGGYPGVTLITFRHLPWNAPFYEQHGFVQLDDGDTSGKLHNLMLEEAEAGLAPGKRVAMLLDFSGGSGSVRVDRPA